MKTHPLLVLTAVATCVVLIGLGIVGDTDRLLGTVLLWGGAGVHAVVAICSMSAAWWNRCGRATLIVGVVHLVLLSVAVFPSALIVYTLISAAVYGKSLLDRSETHRSQPAS